MRNLKIESKDWSPFVSDAAKYAFVLLNTSGFDQKLQLGITKKQYDSTEEATGWKNVIEHTLDTADDVPKDIVDAAKVMLYQLYGDMIRRVSGPRAYPFHDVPMETDYEDY